ncbi:MAG: MFS transporter [Elusimicrobia bacterium]|nr:MFS transporter [Elusimicrobiota bacterium]
MKNKFWGLGRDFWLFRTGQLISSIGDGCADIAFMWWLLEKTGSAEKMALIFAPVSFVRIFLIPLFGPAGDRYCRKKVAIISDAWRGVMFLTLAALVKLDVFNLPLVTALFMFTTAGTALFATVSGSIVAQLVKKEELSAAIERSNFVVAVGNLSGGLIGGIAINYFGVTGAFLINSVSFFIATAASCYIRTRSSAAVVPPQPPGEALKVWAVQLKEGFSVVARIPMQLWLCVLLAFINLAVSPLSLALPVLVKDSGALSPGFIGILNAALETGTILGSLVVGWLCRKIFTDKVIFAGIGLIGAGMAALFLVPGAYSVIAIMLMLGMAMMLVNVPLSVKLMAATPDNYRSRVSSVSAFMSQAAVPVGMAFSGFIIAGYGMQFMMIAAGAGVILSAPLLFLVPQFSAFFRMPEPDTHEYFLKKHPKAFCKA